MSPLMEACRASDGFDTIQACLTGFRNLLAYSTSRWAKLVSGDISLLSVCLAASLPLLAFALGVSLILSSATHSSITGLIVEKLPIYHRAVPSGVAHRGCGA